MVGYKTYILCVLGVIVLGLRAASKTEALSFLSIVPDELWDYVLGLLGFSSVAALRSGVHNELEPELGRKSISLFSIGSKKND